MADRTEIRQAILDTLYSNWKREPFAMFSGDDIEEQVENQLDESVEFETMHHILQGLDRESLIEHSAAMNSLGMISLQVAGLEEYSKSNHTVIDNNKYIDILEYLVQKDDESPGQYIDSEEVMENVCLSENEVERNIWYLDKKGYVDLMQALGTTWVATRIEPRGRRFYEEEKSQIQSNEEPPEESLTSAQYDVFISHASEDKDAVVRPLAEELERLGAKVWYDEFELQIGDSLRESIDEGLSQSRYGVVVISEAFFGKNWTEYELNGLTARDMGSNKVVLPLWYEIDANTVKSYSPPLADKKAKRVNEDNVSEVAEELYTVIE